MDKFIDAIGTIRVTNGLVRIQTVRQLQNADGATQVQDRGDLIMPLASFLNLHSGLNAAVEQMVNQGLLTRRNDVAGGANTVEAAADAAEVSDLVDAPEKPTKPKK
jgi:hypothetical protein